MTYAAFISYSRKADERLASALQTALHRFAKPWYKRRAVQVFRDKSDLVPGTGLSSTIQKALQASEFFLLMASPEAAASQWVRDEIEFWKANSSRENFLILLTRGELVWPAKAKDFDWSQTTSLPDSLRGYFTEQPHWVDFRHPSLFSVTDFEDLAGFVERLRTHPNPVSRYLWKRFCESSEPKQQVLTDSSSSVEKAEPDLVESLNKILEDPLNETGSLSSGLLSPETLGLLSKNPQYGDLIRLKRLLLEDAYPEIRKSLSGTISDAELLTLRHSWFRERIIRISSRLRGRLPGDLEGEDVREHRKAMKLAWSAAVALTVLTIASVTGGAIAFWQRSIALSRELAASAAEQLSIDPERSVLLADKAHKTAKTLEAEDALRKALFALPIVARISQPSDSKGVYPKGVAFNPSTSQVATAESDGKVRLWNFPVSPTTNNWVTNCVLSVTNRAVNSVGFSPDGQQLVSACEDGRALVWNCSTGELVTNLDGHFGPINSAAYSSNGRYLATTSNLQRTNGMVVVWNTTTWTTNAVLISTNETRKAAFSPDGELLVATSGANEVLVWQWRKGNRHFFTAHAGRVRSAVFSHDAKWILTTGHDRVARIWSLTNPGGRHVELATLPGHTSYVVDAIFDPLDRLVITASADSTARIWTTQGDTPETVAVLRGHSRQLSSVAVSLDGQRIATASEDGSVGIWQMPGGTLIARHPRFQPLPDGEVRKPTSLQVAPPLLNHNYLRHAGFTDDSRHVVSWSDGWLYASDLTYDLVPKPKALWTNVSERILAISPNGQRVAVEANGDPKFSQTIWVREVGATEKRVPLKGLAKGSRLEFSLDAALVVSYGTSNEVRVWDAAKGTQLSMLSKLTNELDRVALSSDGRRLFTSFKKSHACVWSLGTEHFVVIASLTNKVSSAEFSRKGDLLLTSGHEKDARVWRASDGRLLATLKGHEKAVNWASFSSNADFVITAGGDGVAKIWNWRTAQPLADLNGHASVVIIAKFSPNGEWALTGSDNGEVRIYPCPECRPAENLESLIQQRVTREPRELTPAERQIYLHENSPERRSWLSRFYRQERMPE